MEPAITVENLVVHRGGREVLHGLSTHLPAGVITGLLGPSGSGKTTLMRAVVGVQVVHGLGRTEADETIEAVGLADHAAQLVANLSGGQRSRASLACALVGRPEVLVLDEPTVGQDPVLRDDLWQQFRRLAQEGTTLMVSSHVMDEANRCDRLLLIRQGRIIADDTPQRVKEAAGTDDLDEAFLRLIRQQGQEVTA